MAEAVVAAGVDPAVAAAVVDGVPAVVVVAAVAGANRAGKPKLLKCEVSDGAGKPAPFYIPRVPFSRNVLSRWLRLGCRNFLSAFASI